MTQSELDHAVARATGETVRTIRRLGFTLADPDVVRYDPEPRSLLSRPKRPRAARGRHVKAATRNRT